jgi:deazaflavin-dependent oxidoreductase (nitroreductase family)
MGTAPVAPPAFGSWQWRAGNALVNLLARAGIGPIHLLTTRDRVTGAPHTVPVVPVEEGGTRWLVAPYGPVGWVRDARAYPQVQLRYGRSRQEHAVREVGAEEAGPVLKRYVAVATKTRSQFRAEPDAPAATFAAEADRHPVFELVAVPDVAPADAPADGPASADPPTGDHGSPRA